MSRTSDDELLAEIHRLHDLFNSPPTPTDMDGFGQFKSTTYERHFGSFNEAIKQASLAATPPSNLSPYDPQAVKRGVYVIEHVSTVLDLPTELRQESAKYLKEAAENELLIGKSVKNVAGASLIISMYNNNIGVPNRTITNEINKTRTPGQPIDEKMLVRTYRRICRDLEVMVLPPGPEHYLDHCASALNVTEDVKEKAKEMILAHEEENPTNSLSPTAITAGALYAASRLDGRKHTQQDVAEVTGVTVVTIRNHYSDLLRLIE